MNYLIQSSICLILCYGFYFLFFRKDTSFKRNRIFLNLALVISLVIPIVSIPNIIQSPEFVASVVENIPKQIERISEASAITSTQSNINEIEINSTQSNYDISLVDVYLSISFTIAIYFLWGIFRLKSFINSQGKKYKDDYCIVYTDGKLSTFSYFNYLFWDNSVILSEEEKAQITKHELVHIRGGHSYDLLLIELLKIIFWFNPIIYLYKKSLMSQHEFLADAEVLNHFSKSAYVTLIVRSLFQNRKPILSHSFNHYLIKSRIQMMKAVKNSNSKKNLLIFPLIIGLLFTFSCEDKYLLDDDVPKFKELISFDDPSLVNKPYLNAVPRNGKYTGSEEYNEIFLEIVNEVKIPAEVEGTMYLHFIVGTDGELKNAKIESEIDEKLSQQILQKFIQKTYSGWIPAELNKKYHNQHIVIPIRILSGNNISKIYTKPLSEGREQVFYRNQLDHNDAKYIHFKEMAESVGMYGMCYVDVFADENRRDNISIYMALF